MKEPLTIQNKIVSIKLLINIGSTSYLQHQLNYECCAVSGKRRLNRMTFLVLMLFPSLGNHLIRIRGVGQKRYLEEGKSTSMIHGGKRRPQDVHWRVPLG